MDMNVANNYKYISDEKKYAKLANELGVDGVIGFTMHFRIVNYRKQTFGFGSESFSSTAFISAMAYNKEGTVIWKDSTMREAEAGDTKSIIVINTSLTTDTNFEKLHPSAVEMGSEAMGVLLTRLDETMKGKKTSSLQSVY